MSLPTDASEKVCMWKINTGKSVVVCVINSKFMYNLGRLISNFQFGNLDYI